MFQPNSSYAFVTVADPYGSKTSFIDDPAQIYELRSFQLKIEQQRLQGKFKLTL